ncbi:MAG: SDR family NAD(P)-dependent oxidoreductase [Bacteroidales bacterium]|nr:SDR family NAD(P)-dependent oxidoreductase [Bacteroidales bacterium]
MNFTEYDSILERVKNREMTVGEAINEIRLLKKTPLTTEIYSYDEPFLKDHTINDVQVLIGVTYGSLAINAFFEIFKEEIYVHLHQLNFVKPVELKKDQKIEVLIEPVQEELKTDFQALYRYDKNTAWNKAATGSLQKVRFENKETDLTFLQKDLKEVHDFDYIYTYCYSSDIVVNLGNSYRTLVGLYQGNDRTLARIALSQATSQEENHKYALHPLIIQSTFLAAMPLIGRDNYTWFLPFGIKDIFFHKKKKLEQCWISINLVKNSGEMILFNADIIDDDSQVVAHFSECSMKRIRSAQVSVKPLPQSGLTENPPEVMSAPVDNDVEKFADSGNMARKIQKYLMQKLEKYLPGASKRLSSNANLMEFGLDSSHLVALAHEIEKETGIEFGQSLFFEYPNINELTEFFSKEHHDLMNKFFGNYSQKIASESISSETISKVIQTDEFSTKTKFASNPHSVINDVSEKFGEGDIAIIGMHGTFAGSQNLDQFWNDLVTKKDLIREIPMDHWDYRPWFDANPRTLDKTYCKWGSFINDVDKFDANFFRISPREAKWMDPQNRLLLQSIYACAEDAGYINRLRGTDTGVFIGVCWYDYNQRMTELNLPVDPYVGSGNAATVIPNRISFYFDFKGPSLTFDTACSSSLVALHYACNALRKGECSLAFVGGANLILSSMHYRYSSSIGVLSSTGRCHSFDAAADGYVPGEGIASILLKPLEKAIKDGDQIHAVIKGSAALHGGYTPSLTAPSVVGEENVILKAWENAQIDPSTLSYIEAHGTGTKLGDPVEINSLKKAFKRFTGKEQFCAIGSAKAHIGHAEGAAGIAGVLKVILQMKYKKIPVMPFFQTLNPLIQIDKSPFYINSEVEEWKTLHGIPRRASISSFGFSGAYAHVVMEEFIPRNLEQSRIYSNSSVRVIIVLSAKNADRLKEQAIRLIAYIQENQITDKNLVDIAYTLQVGREAMEERMALLVFSVKELVEKLCDFANGHNNISGFFRGKVKGEINNIKDENETLIINGDLQGIIGSEILDVEYDKILCAWVQGIEFDWNKLYDETKPQLISLPTYPFAKERYWVEIDKKIEKIKVVEEKKKVDVIHPLVQRNTSDLAEISYASCFSGEEIFINVDHVNGSKILPATACLEMARVAFINAMSIGKKNSNADLKVVELRNIVWGDPIVISEVAKEGDLNNAVSITLFEEDKEQIDFEICSSTKHNDLKDSFGEVIHCQGQAIFCSHSIMPHFDLEKLKGEIKNEKDSITNEKANLYSQLSEMGFNYDSNYQGINSLYHGKTQTLAHLLISDILVATHEDYILHPNLIECALQTALLFCKNTLGNSIQIPFRPVLSSLNSLKVIHPCPKEMFALVRYSKGNVFSFSPDDNSLLLDIDLCDKLGKICMIMREVSFRVESHNIKAKVSEKHMKISYPDTLNKPTNISLKFPDAHVMKTIEHELSKPITSIKLVDTPLNDDYEWSTSPNLLITFSHVSLFNFGNGIFSLQIVSDESNNTLSKVLVDELCDVLDRAKHITDFKVLILKGTKKSFLRGRKNELTEALKETRQQNLYQSIISFPYPVIAVMSGDALGAGFLVGALCDFMICNQESNYGFTISDSDLEQEVIINKQLEFLFKERFGETHAKEILSLSKDSLSSNNGLTGLQLQEKGWTCPILSKEKVEDFAQNLARNLSEKPQETLRQLKIHLARHLNHLVNELVVSSPSLLSWKERRVAHFQEQVKFRKLWEKAIEDSFEIANCEMEKEIDNNSRVVSLSLKSKVIKATVYSDEIVLVKMEDREAKNMFSEALVNGLIEVFEHINGAPNYKVVIIKGYENYFASGGTKESLIAIQEGKAKFTENKIIQVALDCKIPVIAAMQGHGIGAGWSFGMFADFVILSEESKYVSPYTNYGFTPGAGATLVFPEKIGYDLARETLFTAREYSGRELKEKGQKFCVLPRNQIDSFVMVLAQQIATHSRENLIALKRQWTLYFQEHLEEVYQLELLMHEKTFVGQVETLNLIQEHFYQSGTEFNPEPNFGNRSVSISAVTGNIANSGEVDLSPETENLSKISSTLKGFLSDELQMQVSEIDEDKQFVDMGLDSIAGVSWVRKINEKYKTSIEATKVYNYPTISQFSNYVKSEIDKIRKTDDSFQKLIVTDEKIKIAKPVTSQQILTNGKKLVSFKKTRLKEHQKQPFESQPEPLSFYQSQSIAVIGVSGQFPQAKNLDEFWQNISQGKNCISEVSQKRWNLSEYYSQGAVLPGKTNCKWMGFLEEYDLFDPLFFNISPIEAESMDPQQRLFLQTSWHSIEDAGYNPKHLSGSKCGVFVGCSSNGYHQQSQKHQWSAQNLIGGATSILAARISYFLNLQGPCLSIDTACSSSLVALASACDSLVSGSSDLALAGGVYVMAGPSMHVMTSQAGMLSPDGKCYTFDQRANGFVPGEAVGVVMLKRLVDAERDHDRIYGVIQGWGVNQDGRTNGITAPNPESQTRLEQEIYEKFRIKPVNIQLVENHGTGTKLGDPIEVEGLKESFKKYTNEKGFCALGSIKSNIGHCLSASGISGFIKVLLALKNKQLPPTINFEKLNEHIDLKDTPFYINTQLRNWETKNGKKRQAAVSSFGFSGTNAHVVVEEYVDLSALQIEKDKKFIQRSEIAIPLSAKTLKQLRQKVIDLLNFLHSRKESLDLIELAYTLQVGREPMSERIGFMVSSVEQLTRKLQAYLNEEHIDGVYQDLTKHSKEGLSLISEDDDLKVTIVEQWISQKKLAKLLNLWVKGFDFDWSRFYGYDKPMRVSLPGYPFAKERYWIEEDHFLHVVEEKSGDQLQNSLSHQDTVTKLPPNSNSIFTEEEQWDKLTYLCRWEEQENLLQSPPTPHSNVLIICNGSAFQFEETIQNFYQKNENSCVIIIRLANTTKQISKGEWLCDIHDPECFSHCLQDVNKVEVFYFLAMNEQLPQLITWEKVIECQENNEIQLLRFIKYLKQTNKIGEKIDSYILTLDNYSIAEKSSNSLRFWGGGCTGFAYSLAQGNHVFKVRNLDLSSKDLEKVNYQEILFNAIYTESPSGNGEVFKIQSGKRYRQTFFKLKREANHLPVFRNRGVYLIAGGSGTIGQIITSNLIKKYDANIVWIGRSSKESEKIKTALKRFEEFTERLDYFEADLTSPESMQRAIEQVKNKYEDIHGAIFSGMVSNSDNSIDQISELEFRFTSNIKTLGSLAFYNALKKESLDFMCYFSSRQTYSFLGASDFTAYTSGITFSDSIVRSLQKNTNFPIGIINWGIWKSSFKERTNEIGTENIDVLEDWEGFACFERFVNELQQNRIHQVLCVGQSKVLTSIMNIAQDEFIMLTSKSPSFSQDYKKLIEIPTDKIANLRLRQKGMDLDKWLIQLLFVQLRRLWESSSSKIPLNLLDLRVRSGIINKYYPWWNACLRILSEYKLIRIKGDFVEDWLPLEFDSVWNSWRLQKDNYCQNPEYKALVLLLNDCLEKLPEVLQGQIPATDVLFPKSSLEKVEGVYKNNLQGDTYNEIVANTVVAYLQKRLELDSRTRLRILEIGAGTGSTSTIIFEKLRDYQNAIEKYCYTDISKAFFLHAHDNFASKTPYLECQLLDIEQSVESQGFELASYDLVIASNVLHATKNIRNTLQNAKTLLCSQGLLILNEVSIQSLAAHLTFGLLDGWWLFEDSDLRMLDSPGLFPESWQRVLEEEGFSQVFFPAEEAHELGQQIILAQSDGIIRRKKQQSFSSSVQAINKEKIRAQHLQSKDFTPRKDPYEYVQSNILGCLSSTLKIAPENIDPNIAFSDYGVDSILGVNFINQVNERLSISLNTAIIFDYSSLNRLSRHVMSAYSGQIDAKLNSEKDFKQNDINNSNKNFQNPEVRTLSNVHDTISRIQSSNNIKTTEIAVIGVSGQFPKAGNVKEFWRNLIMGIDGVEELPFNYFDQEKYFSKEKKQGKTRCKWGGVLSERDCFDPLFFNISPREAESMSPHQRLVLQEGWKAIEDAGYNPRNLSGSQTGIFIGAEPVKYMGKSFTGASDAIVASRLSYFLNLNGPAFVVNTGCSSSAVAIHQACESLKNRETDLALAGGVNACMDHTVQVSLDEVEMLSPSGRCFTFDSAGDGTIISEGVGMLVLKRLEDAIASGDSIYGVICGSGINQDGASNGITAPNGAAQEELILNVYSKYQIDPGKISYVEAHGTGTKLGDPVEANALVRVFKKFTQKQEYCAVGSAKSHIGHTAAAAGVIGLIKVLLSIQHKRIPKLLNFKTINPLIEFKDSPFSIPIQESEWISTDGFPRMAVLNSFGHSGTNAHLVIREVLPVENRQTPISSVSESSVIIPFSAKTKEQLRQKVCDLIDYLSENEHSSIDLTQMAYTLQVGREAMEERLGFIVSSLEELGEKLQAYRGGLENGYQGQVKRGKDSLTLFRTDTDLRETVNKWVKERKFSNLLDLWVKGLELEWDKFYGEVKPKRINLPAYPFAKERYWINQLDESKTISSKSINIHPLLHTNSSNLNHQSYSSIFSGEEFFLRDHKVMGQKVLPGVVYLEMARAAFVQATTTRNESAGGKKVIELHNVVWAQPIVVKDSIEISIALYPSNEKSNCEKIDYEIFSIKSDGERVKETIHGQGQITFVDKTLSSKLDLVSLREQMIYGKLDASDIYPIYSEVGIDFGTSFRGITSIYRGNKQVFAQLSLPVTLIDSHHDYLLHPSLMDSAIQSSIGLFADTNNLNGFDGSGYSIAGSKFVQRPLLPFALESLCIISPCTKEMFAWVRYSVENSEGNKSEDKITRLDIDLCDFEGNICVQMRGFSFREISSKVGITKNLDSNTGLLLAVPIWEPCSITSSLVIDNPSKIEYSNDAHHYVIFCEHPVVNISELQNFMTHVRFVSLHATLQKSIAERYGEYALACFELLQTLLKSKPSNKVLIQIVIVGEREKFLYSGLSGLFKTAHLENPLISSQFIFIESNTTSKDLVSKLLQNKDKPQDAIIKYEQGDRFVIQWREIQEKQDFSLREVPNVFKDCGVYIITGGLGGLGILFAREILCQTSKAKIILTGRSILTEKQWQDKKSTILKNLSENPNRLDYHQLELSNLEQVKQFITEVNIKHGQFNGIIHSAGMIADNFILKKTTEEFTRVLEPKVVGTLNLDEATRDLDLDFMVLFSSTSTMLGNVGQADYATANGFIDQFAAYRNQLVNSGVRKGKTLSVNWPLWQDGGMKIHEAKINILLESAGIHPMSSTDGMRIFNHSIMQPYSQIMGITGELSKMRRTIFENSVFQNEPWIGMKQNEYLVSTNAEIGNVDKVDSKEVSESLIEKTQNFISIQFSSVLKIPINKIDLQASLDTYGIDSITAMELTNQLEKTFGSLPKTIFFEYRNIHDVSEYFIKSYGDRLVKLFSLENETHSIKDTINHNSALESKSEKTLVRRFSRQPQTINLQNSSFSPTHEEPIAIIGLSGRYPNAINIEEYWNNLRSGRDCITEIPLERWDWREYYSQDRNKEGFHHSKWGGFISGADEFDASFFNFSQLEAKFTDPQERLFLQHAWMALEDAGYTLNRLQLLSNQNSQDLPAQVGVYVGVMFSEYQLFGVEASMLGKRMGFAGNQAGIANRVSYFFDLHGPSMTVDTMCSSSLTAIHLACQDLRMGRTQLAIAGGVNLTIHPNKYLFLSATRSISSADKCQSFGEGSDGYIPSEGVGTVILKRLSEAQKDGDHIYGLIKGSALNHGGKTNAYSVPNPQAQAKVISRAMSEAQVNPRHISYIEAHGTGTILGDPIEILGLSKAFSQDLHQDSNYCFIGSAKSNIGHCESAAGIAGLTKILLQMKYKQIVPSLHSEKLNPHIDFDKSPFVVNQSLRSWEQPIMDGISLPRIAGLSCFGAGGSNAHMIVEEYIPVTAIVSRIKHGESQDKVIIPLSARTPEQLKQKVRDMLVFLETIDPSIRLIDIAYTLQVGREVMEERLGFLVNSIEQLADNFRNYLDEVSCEGEYVGKTKGNHEDLDVLNQDDDMIEAIDKWIVRKKYSKLLELWVKGLKLDWNKFYPETSEEIRPRLISLPTYPFARDSYWVDIKSLKSGIFLGLEIQPSSKMTGDGHFLFDSLQDEKNIIATKNSHKWKFSLPKNIGSTENTQYSHFSVGEKAKIFVEQLIVENVHRPLEGIDPAANFIDLGLTSMGILKLSQEIQQKMDISFQPALLFEYNSISSLCVYLAQHYSMAIEQFIVTRETSSSQFPELIHLNNKTKGRPIFWFHGGLGGVQPYHIIADKIQRPFYGIQARGYQTEHSPLNGVQSIAEYYVEIIRSIQVEGPYDLGGYSLGGLIAYEVTRQLQILGQKVNTIVMLDSFDDKHQMKESVKSNMLLGANTVLLSLVAQNPENIEKILIHRSSIDENLDSNTYLSQLIDMIQKSGLQQTRNELERMIMKTVELIHAYDVDNFVINSLKEPQATHCYYIRNKNGLYLGGMEPFFTTADNTLDHTFYWKRWQELLPNIHFIDVDSSSHAMMLTESKSIEAIIDFCRNLYSGEKSS